MLKYITAFIMLMVTPFLMGASKDTKPWESFKREPTKLVYDQGEILGKAEKDSLEAELKNFYEQKQVTVAVATIKTLNGYDSSEYSNRLYNHLSIGDKSTNKGVLILVSKDDKEVRIEVGYGCEGEITDAFSKDIIENKIIPQFKEGKFFDGISYALGSIEKKYDYTSSNKTFVVKNPVVTVERVIWGIVLFIILNIIGFATIGWEATIDLDFLILRILLMFIGSSSSSSGGSGGSSGGGGSRGKW